ncbi:uncharacterized protein LOC119981864 [Tripterygium wilfordii]|uniref:uncharacterized protein LOC119981864 n=1 Tax=Tripterygium wilfordii TaxID=458696 RepID=UPI0018F85748|nr:uncharacterized protein LOC119981864 [Tripterygium wilfordii]
MSEKISYIPDLKTTPTYKEGDSDTMKIEYEKYQEDGLKVKLYMLASMSNELQRQHKTKPDSRTSVHDHVIKIINHIERLKQLGVTMDTELQTDLVLQSLPDSFSQFVMNFNMNKIQVALHELLNL